MVELAGVVRKGGIGGGVCGTVGVTTGLLRFAAEWRSIGRQWGRTKGAEAEGREGGEN